MLTGLKEMVRLNRARCTEQITLGRETKRERERETERREMLWTGNHMIQPLVERI